MTEKSMQEQLEEISGKLDTLKEKKFKLPLGIGLQSRKINKDYALILYIKTNGSAKFSYAKIEDNTVKVGDYYYDASAGNVLRYKGRSGFRNKIYPLIVIPEWNTLPIANREGKPEAFSPKENMEEAVNKGTLTSSDKLILTKLEMEAVKPKMSFGGLKPILIIVGILVVGYFILNAMGVKIF